MAIHVAFRRDDGWRVASMPAVEVVETDAGAVRTRATFREFSRAPVLGEGDLQDVFTVQVVDERDSTDAYQRHVSRNPKKFVLCGTAHGGYCTSPIDWTSDFMPSISRAPDGKVVFTETGGSAHAYRMVFRSRPK